MRPASLAALVALAAVTFASPASSAALSKGTLEINGDFVLEQSSVTLPNDEEETFLDIGLNAGFGWSISDPLQLGLGVLLTHQSLDGDDPLFDYTIGTMGLTGDVTWNFATGSNLIPFVRAGAGFPSYTGDFSDLETTLILPFVRAGVRAMVGELASVNISAGYARETNAGGIEDADGNGFNVRAGLSIFPIRGQ